MRINMIRLTEAHRNMNCWLCSQPLWRESECHWNRARQEYVTDQFQRAFQLKAETAALTRYICNTCRYLEPEDLRAHVARDLEELEEELFESKRHVQEIRELIARVRALVAEPFTSPSAADRHAENRTVAAWNDRDD